MTQAGLSKEDVGTSNTAYYYYADLAISQFEGGVQLDQGGSLETMQVESGKFSSWEWFSHGIMEQANPNAPKAGAPEIEGTNHEDRWWRLVGRDYISFLFFFFFF
jgi:hypothetical protein